MKQAGDLQADGNLAIAIMHSSQLTVLSKDTDKFNESSGIPACILAIGALKASRKMIDRDQFILDENFHVCGLRKNMSDWKVAVLFRELDPRKGLDIAEAVMKQLEDLFPQTM